MIIKNNRKSLLLQKHKAFIHLLFNYKIELLLVLRNLKIILESVHHMFSSTYPILINFMVCSPMLFCLLKDRHFLILVLFCYLLRICWVRSMSVFGGLMGGSFGGSRLLHYTCVGQASISQYVGLSIKIDLNSDSLLIVYGIQNY